MMLRRSFSIGFFEVTNNPLTGSGFYQMKGKVVDDFGVFAVEVKRMKKQVLKSG